VEGSDPSLKPPRAGLRDLTDIHFLKAGTVVLVQDNLNIHCKASLCQAFSGCQGDAPGQTLRMALVSDSSTFTLLPD
jgi:hypothetical protein